jgi:hemerythrin HHE cation binding domain-containing protein
MPESNEPQETEQGRALFQELLWVHSVVRRDLDTVRRLAAEVVDGLPAEQLNAELDELQTKGPLWQLKVNCLRYCRFVHMHHRAEDVLLFPRLRETDSNIGPVVDRLEADHRRVSDDLDEVEAAAAHLTNGDSETARKRVAGGLNVLAENLLAHLDFEEREAGPTLRRLERL